MDSKEWMKADETASLRECIAQAFVSDVFMVVQNHYTGPITLADDAMERTEKPGVGVFSRPTDLLNQHLVQGIRDVISRPGEVVSREISDWSVDSAPGAAEEFVLTVADLTRKDFLSSVGRAGLLARVGQVAGHIYRLLCPFLNAGREAQPQDRTNNYYLEGRLLSDMWSRVADLPFRINDTSFFGREWYQRYIGSDPTDLSVFRTVTMIDPAAFRHAYIDGNGWPALLDDHGHHGSRLYSIMATSFWDVIGKEIYGG